MCKAKSNASEQEQNLPLQGAKATTLKVDGGLGKHIVFSTMLPALHKKFGVLNIISAYPEVFDSNPLVQFSIAMPDYEHNKQHFREVISKIHKLDPYDTEFSFDDSHILAKWCEMYGIEDVTDAVPNVVLAQELVDTAGEVAKDLGKFIIVQFSGGQSPAGFNESSSYQQNNMTIERNYPYQMAQILVDKLRVTYPDHTVLNCSLPNEYNLIGAVRVPINFKVYFELVRHATAVVCIDSMLQHITATSGTPMVVLWNGQAWNPSHKYSWDKPTIVNMEAPNLVIDYNDVVDTVTSLTEVV